MRIAHGATVVPVDHRAGRRSMNAELVLDGMRAHIVACAVRHDLRNQEQRNAFGAGRRVGQPRKHEMDDVVGQVVLAIGDEDFRAGDAIAAVVRAFGLAAQRADVGAGLRLGELHRAHPFAADELAEIFFLERVAAVGVQRVDRRHGQDWARCRKPSRPSSTSRRRQHSGRAAGPGRPNRPARRGRSIRPRPRRCRPLSSRAAS